MINKSFLAIKRLLTHNYDLFYQDFRKMSRKTKVFSEGEHIFVKKIGNAEKRLFFLKKVWYNKIYCEIGGGKKYGRKR
ncbi:MAG: hypothetical protein DBX41_06605 [Clostridiales bacterium]|nr:MAG: hypothetical protein DBX41_06605 [Clostridiales bacterium]